MSDELTCLERLESYNNGNIEDLKNWLNNEATLRQLVHFTALWIKAGYPMLKLKAYIEEAVDNDTPP